MPRRVRISTQPNAATADTRGTMYPPRTFLRNHRNYPFYADRVLRPVAEQLAALAAWARAVSVALPSKDWREAADALERAAEVIRQAAK
jgi:hypothetical protein